MTAPADVREANLPATGIPTGKLGVWLFLVSEVMFFGALVGSYLLLRMGARSWPDPARTLDTALLGANTFVLITSSVTMVLAVRAAERNDLRGLRRNLLLTILLGTTFLALKGLDYAHLFGAGITIDASLFGASYFTLTGFHGLHVLAGIVALASLLAFSRRPAFARRREWIENAGLYWHFVDVVWILLFVLLCLL
ncbi:MAG TPA: cytochrome c oxidase subunit 3 [Planctomycetota bacterium]|nr:cytochrome c oxidase subunit 3 [Planctomycetota bacterium]